jgi:UDP-N-acetylmuramate dehydrogenase
VSKFQYLDDIKDIVFHQNTNLEKYTTTKLSCEGDIVIVKSIIALQKLIIELHNHSQKYHLVGWGANQILHNTHSTLFIKLDFNFDRNILAKARDEYVLPASTSLNVLTSHAQKYGLRGWEVFTGIPATLGGAIFMNAGTALGEIGQLIKEVMVLNSEGNLFTYQIQKNDFSYRRNNFLKPGDIILQATMIHFGIDPQVKIEIANYLAYRKETQPLTTKNCGCIFKNVGNEHKAGQYIDVLGLKGVSLSGLRLSKLHANFIENINGAKPEDFCELVDIIQYELEAFCGIKFELEAKIY